MSIGIGYYAFSLFVAGLVCLIAIICKVLFANVKRQHKLLDEKESKLLRLYQSVESIIEIFDEQVKATIAEIREFENRTATIAASFAVSPPEPGKNEPEQREKSAPSMSADSNRPRPVSGALAMVERIAGSDTEKSHDVPAKSDSVSVFQRFFDETLIQSSPPVPETASKQERNETILALAEEGKTDAQIARELSITQNEVRLIIDLTGKRVTTSASR